MDWRERIELNPKVLVGKPVVKGTRLSVEFIITRLAQGATPDELVHNHPRLTREDILACLAYAAELLEVERVYPVAT